MQRQKCRLERHREELCRSEVEMSNQIYLRLAPPSIELDPMKEAPMR